MRECDGERVAGGGKRALPVIPAGGGPEGWTAPAHERRDAAEHRRRILATARALFDARGVDAVSMHEIGRAVGVGQGTLYRRYPHKGALCGALLEESMRRLQEDLLARLGRGARPAADGPEPALAQLDYFLTRLARFNEENAALLGAVAEHGPGGRRHSVYSSPVHDLLRRTATALLRRAVAEGEIAPLDIEIAADVVLAPLTIDLYLHQRQDLGLPPERILAAARRIVFDGLRGRAVGEVAGAGAGD